MTKERQIEMMEKQLSFFPTLLEKMQYMANFFDPDPQFTKEARDIVRSNIAVSLRDIPPPTEREPAEHYPDDPNQNL